MQLGDGEFLGAALHRAGKLTGDNADVDAGELAQALDTHAVADGKSFHFLARSGVVYPVVCQHAVAVGEQQANGLCSAGQFGR